MHVIACNELEIHYIVLQIHYMSLHRGGFADMGRRPSHAGGHSEYERSSSPWPAAPGPGERANRAGAPPPHEMLVTVTVAGLGPGPGPGPMRCEVLLAFQLNIRVFS